VCLPVSQIAILLDPTSFTIKTLHKEFMFLGSSFVSIKVIVGVPDFTKINVDGDMQKLIIINFCLRDFGLKCAEEI